MPLQKPPTALESTFSSLISSRRSRSLLRRLTTVPPGTVDFSSNDYLSLSTNPDIRQAFLNLLSQEGYSSHPGPVEPSTSPPPQLGSRGSRLLDGNHPFADSLEALIAAHHNSPSALLFTSGFDANVGLFSCAPQPGDLIVYDELIHASVHDGMRLSRVPAARRLPFRHNSANGLREMLGELAGREGGVSEGRANVFVAVEAVYSMDGDLAPLREIVDVIHEVLPRGNGYLIVDEAHATGVFGQRGRGLCSELGVEDKVFARVVTFGKAVGSQGAVVLCSKIAREYLINYARTLIYTTAMSFPSLASIRASYDFMISGRTEALVRHLQHLIRLTHRLLSGIVSTLAEDPSAPAILALSPLGDSISPIIPVFTPQPRSLASHCQAQGLMVRPIVAPTVPHGTERVRVCLHAGNTEWEVEKLAISIGEWVDMQVKEKHHWQPRPVQGRLESANPGDEIEKARL
ncbi:aminotransferase class I and II [Diaporthe eres]|uniref:Aminotransferase class I/classII large domain-containing protein n=1 Tax=Diaporthe vaccinii TaxID=105482 RepID=A0ABR4EVB8_9PEZI|nr:aminotransferase class I and II [Diaporthe eres]